MDYSWPGSSVCGTFQARILEWVAISSSRGSFWPRDWTCISCVSYIGRQIPYYWATWESCVQTKAMIFDPCLRSVFQCYSCPRMTKTETKELFLVLPTFIPLSLNHHSPIHFTFWIFSNSSGFLYFHCSNMCYSLIIGLPSHHLCRILLVMSESQVLPTLKGKSLERHNNRKPRSWGHLWILTNIKISTLPHFLRKTFSNPRIGSNPILTGSHNTVHLFFTEFIIVLILTYLYDYLVTISPLLVSLMRGCIVH